MEWPGNITNQHQGLLLIQLKQGYHNPTGFRPLKSDDSSTKISLMEQVTL